MIALKIIMNVTMIMFDFSLIVCKAFQPDSNIIVSQKQSLQTATCAIVTIACFVKLITFQEDGKLTFFICLFSVVSQFCDVIHDPKHRKKASIA
jgi:hypothetical protein